MPNKDTIKLREDLRTKLMDERHEERASEAARILMNEYQSLNPGQIAALKGAADISVKLLNKYLPDLKAVEMTGEAGGDIKVNLTTEEWAAIRAEMLEEDDV